MTPEDPSVYDTPEGPANEIEPLTRGGRLLGGRQVRFNQARLPREPVAVISSTPSHGSTARRRPNAALKVPVCVAWTLRAAGLRWPARTVRRTCSRAAKPLPATVSGTVLTTRRLGRELPLGP